MQINVKVEGLTLRQWDWLQHELMTSYEFAPWDVRVCVVFELVPEMTVRHVEMPAVAFAGLVTVLKALDLSDIAQAALVPDELDSRDEAEQHLKAVREKFADYGEVDQSSANLETVENLTERLTGDRPSWETDFRGDGSGPEPGIGYEIGDRVRFASAGENGAVWLVESRSDSGLLGLTHKENDNTIRRAFARPESLRGVDQDDMNTRPAGADQ